MCCRSRIYLNYFILCFEGGETDINDVKHVLEKMGIDLKEKEMLKLLKNLPVNGENFEY